MNHLHIVTTFLKIIFLIALAIFLTQCEKCFDCELKINGVVQKKESFCGSNEEADTLEAAGFTCSSQ